MCHSRLAFVSNAYETCNATQLIYLHWTIVCPVFCLVCRCIDPIENENSKHKSYVLVAVCIFIVNFKELCDCEILCGKWLYTVTLDLFRSFFSTFFFVIEVFEVKQCIMETLNYLDRRLFSLLFSTILKGQLRLLADFPCQMPFRPEPALMNLRRSTMVHIDQSAIASQCSNRGIEQAFVWGGVRHRK